MMDILKEAEMIIENYIYKIEKKEKENKQRTAINNKLKRKYSMLKKYTIILSILLVISLVLHFIW